MIVIAAESLWYLMNHRQFPERTETDSETTQVAPVASPRLHRYRVLLSFHSRGSETSRPIVPMKRSPRMLLPAVALIVLTFTACRQGQESSESQSSSAEETVMRPDAATPAGGEGNVPSGWTVRADRGSATVASDSTGDIFFVNMTPGWHITTGPAATYFNEGSTASGDYTARMDVYLFDPKGRREAFGLLFGGTNLNEPTQRYAYFLIRQGGQFLVKKRAGDVTETVIDWTDNDAIKSWTPEGDGTAFNTLAATVTADSVLFFANDTKLASISAESVPTNGLVGFRINHGLNLHVSGFEVVEQ